MVFQRGDLRGLRPDRIIDEPDAAQQDCIAQKHAQGLQNPVFAGGFLNTLVNGGGYYFLQFFFIDIVHSFSSFPEVRDLPGSTIIAGYAGRRTILRQTLIAGQGMHGCIIF